MLWIKIKNGLQIKNIEAPSKAQFIKAFKTLRQLAASIGLKAITIKASTNTLIKKK